jgi:hypothetical protein
MRPEEAAEPRTAPKIPNPSRQTHQEAETNPRGEEGPIGETSTSSTWEMRHRWEGGDQGRRQSKKHRYGEERPKRRRQKGGDQRRRKPKMGPNPPGPRHGVRPPGSVCQCLHPPQRRRWGESTPEAATRGGPQQMPNLELRAHPPWAAHQNLPLLRGEKQRKDHRMTAGPRDLPWRSH